MKSLHAKTIAILGAGTMGRIILDGLIASGHPRARLRATTRTPAAAAKLRRQLAIAVTSDNAAAVAAADIVVLALKPAAVAAVARELAAVGALKANALVISIAAGVSTASLREILGNKSALVRAMPNTPCSVGHGMTALARGPGATAAHLAAARALFAPLGRTQELEEKHFDTVTGLSASGPAFIFVIIEALADGGVARGLPRDIAIEMAAQMVYGAAAMVLRSGRHPAALKDEVTTPAGCTIAGILALEDGRIRSVLSRAVEVASLRAAELGMKV